MSEPLPQLTGIKLPQLQALFKSWSIPAFRAKQVLQWVLKGVTEPDEMKNIPADLKQLLLEKMECSPLVLVTRQVSTDGTRKYLFRLKSGKTVETVYIPDAERGTVCVSTQVGCVLDCPFCFTGTQKFEANLSGGEIIAQILAVKHDLRTFPPGEGISDRVTNVVYMGMGEPLANEKGVHESLDILLDEEMLAISRRRITVSTSGLIPAIERLGEAYPVNLAVSLHAAIDELRDELVPINQKYPLAELRKCLNLYTLGKQRHITLEYIMLEGVNDRPEDLEALARFANHERERVNLISFNPYPGNPYSGTPREAMDQFAKDLIQKGVRATVRRSRGQDIMAACGQLKSAKGD